MRKVYLLLMLIAVSIPSACTNHGNSDRVSIPEKDKPKLIICTDIGGDPDDQQSLTRLLLYSNDIDILGMIASASGAMGEEKKYEVKPQMIIDHINAYGKVQEKLKLHDPAYPEASLLKERVKSGNPFRGIGYIGEDFDSEGSQWIIQQVDESLDEKVNIAIWGGQTDVVQALWRVKNDRDFESYIEFISGIRIYDINDQDGLYSYIREEFPELFYILSKAKEGMDKREGAYRGMYYGGDESSTSSEWLAKNVRNGHGDLGELYPATSWTDPNPHGALKEGDTPSWFYFLEIGLQVAEHPEWGGWGGRFLPSEGNFFRDADDFAGGDFHPRATVYRWRQYFQNDFQARMDWCVSLPSDVNHPPLVVVNGDESSSPLFVIAKDGGQLNINTIGTSDPDNDELSYAWWIYPEAGTAHQCPEMWPIDEADVPLEIPVGETGREMHLICEVTDNGHPALTSFRRIIIKIVE